MVYCTKSEVSVIRGFTHFHSSARVVRTTIRVNGEEQNLIPATAKSINQLPQNILQISWGVYCTSVSFCYFV